MNDLLPWERFWYPVGEDTPFDRGGFLNDPDTLFADIDVGQPYPLGRERDTPVLVLFGEAGMGKTTAIRREALGDPVLDLGTLDAVTLRARFEQQVLRAASGEAITVWLDSLDECRIDTPRIERILGDVIANIAQEAIDRLYLRIVGRSVEDPQMLLATLAQRWGEGAAKTLALCPLRERDARLAAQHAHIDPDAFLDAVHERDVAHLARRPKTLFHLISVFAAHLDFPARRWELHEQAMHRLVSETPGRAHQVNLDIETRMRIAGRIATILLLSQRNLIHTAGSHDALPVSLSLDSLVGAEPRAEYGRVTLAELRETLQVAGLFQHGDDGNVRFSHRSDAEFLAAHYLARSDIKPETIRRLIEYPRDGSLPPQMAGVAGWLAETFPALRRWMLTVAPLVVLQSELSLTETERTEVIEKLLEAARDEGVVPHERPTVLARTHHERLVEQLRPSLVGRDVSIAERHVAVRLLWVAGVAGKCITELIDLLQDEQMPWGLRLSVLHALSSLLAGTDNVIRTRVVDALLPHAMAPPDNEASVMLKGAALEALWPGHLDVQQLFDALVPRTQAAPIGSYESFMSTLPATLTPDHLPTALRWVREQYAARHQAEFNIRRLAGRIMRRAWTSLDEPPIREAFADAARVGIADHVPLFANEWSPSDKDDSNPLDEIDKRRILAMALADRIDNSKERYLVGLELLRNEDARWLLDTIESPDDTGRRERLSDLFAGIFHWNFETSVIDRVLELAGPNADAPIPSLQQALGRGLGPISLEDEDDIAMRREHHQRLQRLAQQPKTDAVPSVRDHIDHALPQADGSDPNVWLTLLEALSTPRPQEWLATPVADLDGWSHCSPQETRQIHQAARQYIRAVTPSDNFLHLQSAWNPRLGDAAGYAAWELLICDAPPEDCPADALPPWRGLLLTKPRFGARSTERRRQVLQYLQDADPNAFPREVEVGLRREARDGLRGSELLHDLGGVRSGEIAGVLRVIAQDPDIVDDSADALWACLLVHGDTGALAHLCTEVESGEAASAQRAASLLFEHTPGAAWNVLGPFLEADRERAQDVIEPTLHRLHGNACNPIEAGPWPAVELYAIIERLYPRDSRQERAGGVMLPVDHADMVKNNLLRSIVSCGRWDAVDALNWLREQLTDHDWLRRVASDARQKALEMNWGGNDPAAIVELLADTGRRVVQSDEHLLAVVEESLHGLQTRLHGETPMAVFLWVPEQNGASKHRDENRISDFVRDHLTMHIIGRKLVIHREVEVRNLNERGIGERTDLMVDAHGAGHDDHRHTVVIEVKGDWHADVLTAMDEQLAGRYLREGIARCGLYLALWSGTQVRKFGSPEDLRFQLERKAADLSDSDVAIRAFVLDITL